MEPSKQWLRSWSVDSVDANWIEDAAAAQSLLHLVTSPWKQRTASRDNDQERPGATRRFPSPRRRGFMAAVSVGSRTPHRSHVLRTRLRRFMARRRSLSMETRARPRSPRHRPPSPRDQPRRVCQQERDLLESVEGDERPPRITRDC